ncbi:MAG: hypothetical protein ACREJ2_00820, partial [Planctomycetota bacterium]
AATAATAAGSDKAAKGAKVTANERQRLAAQRLLADLAWTWHRAWQLGRGAADPAGDPPTLPPPPAAVQIRTRALPMNLIHAWFEEAVAALQFNVRTELVLKALAVRLAR